MDPIAQFKENQKATWSSFAPLEAVTGSVAPHLEDNVLRQDILLTRAVKA